MMRNNSVDSRMDDLRLALISACKEAEALGGGKLPETAKLERGKCDMRISRAIKILVPLGKTLAIVPLKKNE